MEDKLQAGNGQGRTWRVRAAAGLNAGMAVLLAAVLFAMVNYLSYRHFRRADISRAGYARLSDKTLELLKGLTNDIQVYVFLQPGQESYEDVDNLLREYQAASSRIGVERVDPDRDLARTEELARRFQVPEANGVVFDAGGRSRYVGGKELVEMDYTPMRVGQPPTKVAFRGEQAFSSAIQSITQARRPVVYFLQGHGERDITSFDRVAGFSRIAQLIARDNVETRQLVFGAAAAVPDDCDALIVAGPEKRLAKAELDLVRQYLDRKGRLLVLLDPLTETGLENLLGEWGLALGDDVVVDATRTLSGRELFVNTYGNHPITRRLEGITAIFQLPRSVEAAVEFEAAADPADRPRPIVLAACTESGWAETDLAQSPMKFDPGRDRPGPVGVAAAVEKGPVPGFDVQIRPTRIVVFGDSDFVANGGLVGGNGDLFLSALNWLLEREQLLAIAPKPVEEARLIMDQRQLLALFWVLVVFLPAGVAVLGVAVWVRRRV